MKRFTINGRYYNGNNAGFGGLFLRVVQFEVAILSNRRPDGTIKMTGNFVVGNFQAEHNAPIKHDAVTIHLEIAFSFRFIRQQINIGQNFNEAALHFILYAGNIHFRKFVLMHDLISR